MDVLLRARRTGRRLLGILAIAVLGVGFHQLLTWPDVAALEDDSPESWAFLKAAKGNRGVEHQWVPYEAISSELKVAVLVAEDINFFSHGGFDTGEIRNALTEAWKGERSLRGASTITQQLVKNLWLSPSRNPWRKVKEAILTTEVEGKLDKRRILELYLNVVEFGPGAFGAEAAARRYFDRSAARLTRRQAAQLAASLPHSAWHPESSSGVYRRHVERIMGRMERAGEWLRKEL